MPEKPDKTMEAAANCRIPGCEGGADFRGLCQRCYDEARDAIQRGEITEAELMTAGIFDRVEQTPFRLWLDSHLVEKTEEEHARSTGASPAAPAQPGRGF